MPKKKLDTPVEQPSLTQSEITYIWEVTCDENSNEFKRGFYNGSKLIKRRHVSMEFNVSSQLEKTKRLPSSLDQSVGYVLGIAQYVNQATCSTPEEKARLIRCARQVIERAFNSEEFELKSNRAFVEYTYKDKLSLFLNPTTTIIRSSQTTASPSTKPVAKIQKRSENYHSFWKDSASENVKTKDSKARGMEKTF